MTVIAQDKPTLEQLLDDTSFNNTVRNLAYNFYGKFGSNPMVSIEDLTNEGLLAAATAYTSFDYSRGFLFKTHAFPYIKHAMQTYCRKFCHVLSISEKESRLHLDDMLNVGVLRIDQKQDDENSDFDIPVGSGVDISNVGEYFFIGFSAFEKLLAQDYFLNDLSTRELSLKYNVSRSRVGSIMQDLTRRMRDRVNQDED